MGRHGDHAAGERTRRGDKKAGGVVIPLAAAVLVCLLATSGVWLMTAEKDGDERDTTPIGLNVPTEAPGTNATGTDGPTAGAKGMQGEKPNPSSASPTASATGSKTPTPSKSTTKPATSAPPSSAPPPSSSAPPPPKTTAPPQPKEYAVAASATTSQGGWRTELTITVTNANPMPLGVWKIVIQDVNWARVEGEPPPGVAFENRNTLARSGGVNGATTVTLRLSMYVLSDEVRYTFNDTEYTVQIRQR